MKVLVGLFALVLLFTIGTAHAVTQTVPTEDGTLDVRITYDPIVPDEETKIRVDFLNPLTGNIQEHIDYTFSIVNEDEQFFGPTSLTHTSPGTITIPLLFKSAGLYSLGFTVEGILFQPIPAESVWLDIPVGVAAEEPEQPMDTAIPVWIKSMAGWWADGQIDDATFVQGLEYLIQNEILVIPAVDGDTDPDSGNSDADAGPLIPSWIKSNAGWWADGQIDDDTFVKALQFLITQGIIQVP